MEIDEYYDDERTDKPQPDNTKSSGERKVTIWERLDRWIYGQSTPPDAPRQTKKGRGRHSW